MPSAFEKRVKRRVIARPQTFFAVCPPGLARTCERELRALSREADADIKGITPLSGGLQFTGRLTAGYRANLCLASPSRILMRLAEFKADSFQKLEKQLDRLDWDLFLAPNAQVEIKVSTQSSRLYHSHAVAQRCHGIIDRALARSEGPADPNPMVQTLMVRAVNDRFQLSLDMSGPALYKRGIKSKITPAPLRETLAFTLLTAAGFTPDLPVLDPMCGSGTFSFETARIKAGIAPGFFRSFAFEGWPAFRPGQLAHLRRELAGRMRLPPHGDIFASDQDPGVIRILESNMETPLDWPETVPPEIRDFRHCIQPRQQDFFSLTPPPGPPGIILLNPPYGKRLDKGMDTRTFYREMGKKLKSDFKGWKLGLIFPDKKIWKLEGLPLASHTFFHGGLDLAAGLGTIG